MKLNLLSCDATFPAISGIKIDFTMEIRKIVHIDMDAFYASVEQRDDPQLRGRPVVVAWKGKRSVVCAASYEARRFGVRSAMPAIHAERLCAEAIFVPPDFSRYRAVSQAVREIFKRHTELVEPLSLDEAYLDVTENKTGLPTATRVAKTIRQQIRDELASHRLSRRSAQQISGQDRLRLAQAGRSLRHSARRGQRIPLSACCRPYPRSRQSDGEQVKEIGALTVGDLQTLELTTLNAQFGRYGTRLYELARGIDHNPVIPDRPTKSISAEDTFESDIPLAETEALIRRLAEKVWIASRKEGRIARTVVLKLKTSEFNILTRSHTPSLPPDSCETFTAIALSLRERVDLGTSQRFRLVGVGLK